MPDQRSSALRSKGATHHSRSRIINYHPDQLDNVYCSKRPKWIWSLCQKEGGVLTGTWHILSIVWQTLEHPVPVAQLYDDVLSLIESSGSSYTQVAVMNYGGLFGQEWVHQNHDIPIDAKLKQYVKHSILEDLTEVKMAPNHSYQFFNSRISTRKLAERGVRTNIGANVEQPIGLLFHSEMEMISLGG